MGRWECRGIMHAFIDKLGKMPEDESKDQRVRVLEQSANTCYAVIVVERHRLVHAAVTGNGELVEPIKYR
jgi:hypothetical protein